MKSKIREEEGKVIIEMPSEKDGLRIAASIFTLFGVAFFVILLLSIILFGGVTWAKRLELFGILSFLIFVMAVGNRMSIWMMFGLEELTFKEGKMYHARKNDIFYSTKVYDLEKLTEFGVNNDSKDGLSRIDRIFDFMDPSPNGRLKFKRGYKTFKIASGVRGAEVEFIINFLLEKGVLDRERHL